MVWDGVRFLDFLERRGDFLLRDWARKGWLQMKLLGPGLGGSCTPPHKWLKQFANDAFSLRFDDGFGCVRSPELGEEGGGATKELGAKRVVSTKIEAARGASLVQCGLKRKYIRFNVQWRLKRTLPQVCVQWGLKRELRIVLLKRHSVPSGTYYTTDSAERRVEIASLR